MGGAGGEAGGQEAGAAKEDEDGDSEGEEASMSKKKRKLASRLKIAELKQACERPDVVEVWDVTAMDPKLLVYLKVRSECCGCSGMPCGVWAR